MLKRDFLEKPYDYMNDILLFLYNILIVKLS